MQTSEVSCHQTALHLNSEKISEIDTHQYIFCVLKLSPEIYLEQVYWIDQKDGDSFYFLPILLQLFIYYFSSFFFLWLICIWILKSVIVLTSWKRM